MADLPKPYDKSANRRLNHAGVKNSANMWRTFGGELYPHYAIEPTEEQIAAYRAAGVKCRRVGVELFVREADQALAAQVDQQHGFVGGDWYMRVKLAPGKEEGETHG